MKKPTKPTQPATPKKAAKSAKSAQPAKSARSAKSAQPAKSARSAKPAAGKAERVERVAAPPLSLTLHWRGGQVVRLELGRAEAGAVPPDASPEARAVHAALVHLAAGRTARFPALPLCWAGVPPFTADILRTLAERVPEGRTVTYGELAALAGHPGKARAVGQAMARNPWPLVVPCHRVLGAGGALTGYTNPHGLDLKALLLSLESAGCRGLEQG